MSAPQNTNPAAAPLAGTNIEAGRGDPSLMTKAQLAKKRALAEACTRAPSPSVEATYDNKPGFAPGFEAPNGPRPGF